jgi:hypothetical protein
MCHALPLGGCGRSEPGQRQCRSQARRPRRHEHCLRAESTAWLSAGPRPRARTQGGRRHRPKTGRGPTPIHLELQRVAGVGRVRQWHTRLQRRRGRQVSPQTLFPLCAVDGVKERGTKWSKTTSASATGSHLTSKARQETRSP